MRKCFLLLLLVTAVGCASSATTNAPRDRSEVDAVLDAWHSAAAEAKEGDYFDRMAPTSIFFGTDATERWTTQQFRDYAHPFFEKGRAWTFHPRNRNVYFSSDGNVAWFDEALDSASYGEMRGTGVLQRSGGRWRIEQYNLTIPIPNDLAKEVVEKIRAGKK